MPRIVRTARGEIIDFDTIIIKQQLAQAPMNVEVARRKDFIDSKEGKVRGAQRPTANTGSIAESSVEVALSNENSVTNAPTKVVSMADDFEIADAPVIKGSRIEAPVPVLPVRKNNG